MEKELRIIISGGGTGGHIFPAVSIANAIIELRPDAEILFVGAEGRMEMQRVPDAGYRIIGLPIAGFDRKHLWKNVSVLIKLMRSQWKARKVIKNFRPQVAVGVGGYASGPTLKTAGMMGVPTLIQEQNSYAGVTNKLLAQKARKICVAYDGMEKFFPADKIITVIRYLADHDEHFSLEHIVPEVIEVIKAYEKSGHCKIPVIAAGGLYTGEDIYRLMQLGATGVQLGSKFVTTEECDASPVFKQAYIDAGQSDIEIITSPVGMPGRAISGEFTRKVKSGSEKPRRCAFHCIKTCDYTKSPYCIIKALYNAAKGNMQKG